MVSRAVLAGIITLIIFLAGFSLGGFWDALRRDKVEMDLNKISLYSTSLFLESRLIENISCDALWPILSDSVKDLASSLDAYLDYSENSITNIDEQKLLYRRYLLSNVRYWLFIEEYKKNCGWNVSTILFFFDEGCGGECDATATRLDYLKQKHGGNVMIFPINMGLAYEDPVAHTLMRIYNVTSFPSVVVDGVRYQSPALAELEGLVCRRVEC